MTIGHHELSICRASRRLCCFSFHNTRSFFTTPKQHKRVMSSPSRYDPDGVLWRRNIGIRFSPNPKTQAKLLCPQLDVAGYSHDSHDASTSEPKPDGHVATGADSQEYHDALEYTTNVSDGTFWPSDSEDDFVEAQELLDHDIADSQPAVAESPSTSVEPPSTSLKYNISPELFQQARQSPTGSSESYWSHTMYHTAKEDGTLQKVKVHYCFSKKTMEWVCKKYFVGEPVLGFDLEWLPWASGKSTARENVSLIQLASPSRIALFHTALFTKDDFVADTFRAIMEDDKVSKVGVAIKADCTRLRKWMGVDTRGILELSHLHKIVKYTREERPDLIKKSLVPLASLVQEYLGLPLFKGDAVRSSDWTKILNSRQINYSAADAYAGLQLYYVIDETRQKLDPCPERPSFAELNHPLPIPIFPAKDLEEVAAIAGAASEPSSKAVEEGASVKTTIDTPHRSPKHHSPTLKAPRDERVIVAEVKAQNHKASKGKASLVGLSALRAYYIWHNNTDLRPADVAKMLREPPLQTNTVVGYILSSIKAEGLPFEKRRLKDECLAALAPETLKSARWESLVKECGYVF